MLTKSLCDLLSPYVVSSGLSLCNEDQVGHRSFDSGCSYPPSAFHGIFFFSLLHCCSVFLHAPKVSGVSYRGWSCTFIIFLLVTAIMSLSSHCTFQSPTALYWQSSQKPSGFIYEISQFWPHAYKQYVLFSVISCNCPKFKESHLVDNSSSLFNFNKSKVFFAEKKSKQFLFVVSTS